MADRRPRQTHELRREGDLITKVYRSWGRREPHREWAALRCLAVHQPGLGPDPITADLDGQPPSITMTVVPGHTIDGRWTEHQLGLLADAMRRLWSAPSDGLPAIDLHEPQYWRGLVAGSVRPQPGAEQDAYDLAGKWINSPELESLLDGRQPQVLGQGDPQPGNMLYDGVAIRLVDFEDSGASDVCFELANFAEHLGTRDTGLHRLADFIDHDSERYRLCRRLIAAWWLFRLLPDPTGRRPARPVDLHNQATRLVGLFNEEP